MENIAYKSFSAFSGIMIHGIEYGIDDKIIFFLPVRWENSGQNP